MGKLNATTIADIAKRAGLSKAAVSMALRNDPAISDKTCSRVQALAKAMDYRPNPLVSANMARVRATNPIEHKGVSLGFVFAKGPDVRDIIAYEYFDGVRDRANALGYRIESFWDKEDYSDERLSRVLASRGIQGIVIGPLPPFSTLSLKWKNFSSVAIGLSLIEPALDKVFFNAYDTILSVLSILKQRGYRRIGIAAHRTMDERVHGRLIAGYLKIGFENQDPEMTYLPPCILDEFEGTYQKEFMAWYKRNRPEVIIGSFGGAYLALRDSDIVVPDEVSYVDFYKQPDGENTSGFNQSLHEIGAYAMDLLSIKLVYNERGIPSNPRTMFINGHWHEGETLPSL